MLQQRGRILYPVCYVTVQRSSKCELTGLWSVLVIIKSSIISQHWVRQYFGAVRQRAGISTGHQKEKSVVYALGYISCVCTQVFGAVSSQLLHVINKTWAGKHKSINNISPLWQILNNISSGAHGSQPDLSVAIRHQSILLNCLSVAQRVFRL